MLISVDLPAPFTPMIPVIDPCAMLSDMLRLARTAPNDLSIDRSSIAAAAPAGASVGMSVRSRSIGAGVVAHVVVHLDLARDDVSLGLIDLGLHLRGDQFFI